jgi:hypothetical protein
MYFIKAEARVAAGDLTGAALAVKSILDNVIQRHKLCQCMLMQLLLGKES